MDGADSNRQFIKLHFHDRDPVQDNFVTANLYTGRPMVFIMDPKVLALLAISLNYTNTIWRWLNKTFLHVCHYREDQ